jgi:hypothetical protein
VFWLPGDAAELGLRHHPFAMCSFGSTPPTQGTATAPLMLLSLQLLLLLLLLLCAGAAGRAGGGNGCGGWRGGCARLPV